MKRVLLFILFINSFVPLFSQNRITLDDAMSDFAQNITSDLPENTRIAVIEFETNSREMRIYFIDKMVSLLKSNNNIDVYERERIENLLREQNFALTGFVSDATAQRIGHIVGVNTVIYGSMRERNDRNNYHMTVTATEVETGRILAQEFYNLRNDSRLRSLLGINWIELQDDPYFWSVGAFVGTSFSEPWVIATINGTLAPFRYSFLEIGLDLGLISGSPNIEQYYSLYPYTNYAFFLPFSNVNLYSGIGIGYMIGERTNPDYIDPIRILAANFKIGLNFENGFDVSYTLRTNIQSVNNKFSVGYVYRFN